MKFIMVREILASLNHYIITLRGHYRWETAFVFPKNSFVILIFAIFPLTLL